MKDWSHYIVLAKKELANAEANVALRRHDDAWIAASAAIRALDDFRNTLPPGNRPVWSEQLQNAITRAQAIGSLPPDV